MIIWVFVTNSENNVLISSDGKQFIFIVSIPNPSTWEREHHDFSFAEKYSLETENNRPNVTQQVRVRMSNIPRVLISKTS